LTPRSLRALIICGPTAAGKSSIAIRAAKSLGGEIVNADSRQVYRGMQIGTGMPPPSDFALVPHHLYGFWDPANRYSAGQFRTDALAAITSICARGLLPIVVGGTGFYVDALTGSRTLDRPFADETVRARLRDELLVHDSQFLWDWLASRRGALAASIRPSDPYRIIRALETTMSDAAKSTEPKSLDLKYLLVRLMVPRDTLVLRIKRRVNEMFGAGLVAEAAALRAAAPLSPALTGLGYAEALAYWDGLAKKIEAIMRTAKRTEQYAKRQETWFRHMREAHVVDAINDTAASARIIALARERLLTT
jgi:tRNA dimethylallyltransferase